MTESHSNFSRHVEKQLETVVHVELLMAVEEGQAVHGGREVRFDLLKAFTTTTSFSMPPVGLP